MASFFALPDLLQQSLQTNFATPDVQPLPDVMSGVNQALAQQQALSQQQSQRPHGLMNFLGMLGDALSSASGGKPMYQTMLKQRQMQSALSGFLTDPDQAIANLMQVDAPSAIELYKEVHPASETPLEVKLWQYENNLPPEQRASFEKSIALTHPGMMAPITLDQGSTIEQPNAGPPQGAVEYLKAHPELAPQFDQKYGPGLSAKILGGATASKPSPTFR